MKCRLTDNLDDERSMETVVHVKHASNNQLNQLRSSSRMAEPIDETDGYDSDDDQGVIDQEKNGRNGMGGRRKEKIKTDQRKELAQRDRGESDPFLADHPGNEADLIMKDETDKPVHGQRYVIRQKNIQNSGLTTGEDFYRKGKYFGHCTYNGNGELVQLNLILSYRHHRTGWLFLHTMLSP